MPRPYIVEYRVSEDPVALSHTAAQYFVDCARAAVQARGKARLAVSGGSTPRATFKLLADPAEKYRTQMPWENLEIYWVDERCLPPDNADSNFHMTRETLLDHVSIPEGQIHRICGELPPEEAAAKYESELRNQFRLEGAQAPVFDVLALGMGDDGHTASLFPHTGALQEIMRLVVANHVPQQKYNWRITLTWPVIVEAREIFFLIAGKDKADPLHRVLQGPYDPETLPSQLIKPRSGRLLMLLDRQAAELLPAPDTSGTGRLEIKR
jgi:6-phosphogluconolactonase